MSFTNMGRHTYSVVVEPLRPGYPPPPLVVHNHFFYYFFSLENGLIDKQKMVLKNLNLILIIQYFQTQLFCLLINLVFHDVLVIF